MTHGAGSQGGLVAVTTPHDPAELLLLLSRKGADMVCYRRTPEPCYLVNTPASVEHVLVTNRVGYNKSTFSNNMFKETVADGLLTLEGAEWQRERSTLQPFFGRDRIASLEKAFAESVSRLIGRWRPLAGAGETIDIAREMSLLSLDATVTAFFGYRLGSQLEEIGGAIDEAMNLITSPDSTRLQDSRAVVRDLISDIIDQRLSGATSGDDLLTILMRDVDAGSGSPRAALTDRIMTLILAGSGTTANALAWTLYLLSRHIDDRRRLESEIREVLSGKPPGMADLPRLSFAHMAIQESMRLYPPAWVLGRVALVDDEIEGTSIPAGTTLALSPYTMQRQPRYWERPDDFAPDRFLPRPAEARPRYSYFPFGAGPRTCIGAHLAMAELVLITTAIAQHYRLNLTEGPPVVPEGRFVLRPRGGIQASVATVRRDQIEPF